MHATSFSTPTNLQNLAIMIPSCRLPDLPVCCRLWLLCDEAISDCTVCGTAVAYMVPCVRFVLFVQPLICKMGNEVAPVVRPSVAPLLHMFCSSFLQARNTRYEWLAKPCSAKTLTLQETPSFSWRTVGRGIAPSDLPQNRTSAVHIRLFGTTGFTFQILLLSAGSRPQLYQFQNHLDWCDCSLLQFSP
jgi:hypothetical protein